MDTSSTVFKALDVLTIVTAREGGVSLPDIALALNQPRTNVVRIMRTLEQYGFVTCRHRQWIATSTFRAWSAPPDRHLGFRTLYHSVLQALAAATGELVTLGLHEGNGILHIDTIEGRDRQCPPPSPEIRYSLRVTPMGKLALSRRPDLAVKIPDPAFQRELKEIRENGVAWSRSGFARGMVGMAIPGFSNLPTEPMVGIAWPESRFSESAAQHAREIAIEAIAASSAKSTHTHESWVAGLLPPQFHALQVG